MDPIRRPVPLLLLALAAQARASCTQSPPAPAQSQPVRLPPVRVDPRVELFSVMFRLAGNPEYSQGRVPAYTEAVDQHFARFRDHAAIKAARSLRGQHGIGFDAVAAMAIHVDAVPALQPLVPLSPLPPSLDARWQPKAAAEFLDKARAFARDTGFVGFLAQHRPLFAVAEERMAAVLAADAHLEWFDQFFGQRQGADFQLVLGMLNGGGCYGPRVRLGNGREQLYCVLGVWSVDDAGQPRFDQDMLGTVVHEFCHSYANPLIEAQEARLVKAGPVLYAPVAAAMKRQAYATWQTMLKESLVRACVVRYQRAVHGADAERKQLAEERGNKFLWIDGLSAALTRYEAARSQHATLQSFMPEVVAFFDQYAEEITRNPPPVAPVVVTMTPANGSKDVDPALTALVVTFDQPMRDGAWAVVGGGPHFPETTGRPSYDAARKVLTIPVRLKPDWDYELWLNRGKFDSFRSAAGVVLEPVRVTFHTRAGKR